MKNKYPWIRLYREALHDPKIVTLSDRHFRVWVGLLLIADDASGELPSMRDVSVHLRMSISEAEASVRELVELELIDWIMGVSGAYVMHGWKERQMSSDNAAERMRKYRARLKEKRNGYRNADRNGDGIVTVQTQTQKERIYNKPSTVDRARSSEIENSNLMVSVNARRQAAVLCRVGDPEPIVAAYLAWPKRGVIQDVDAHFVASAAKIYARLKPAQRAACQPLDDPEPLPPVRASSALRAKLAKGKPHGR